MRNLSLLLLLISFVVTTLSGCTFDKKIDSNLYTYTKISGDEAKKIMNEDDSVIILDVRTEEEYNQGHIEEALLIPSTELTKRASEELSNKDATILVYCRSGNRSARAAQKLIDAGYTNVYDFGGIIDWEYEIIKYEE